jgi:quercetin dioxygenase-like cupin family protein
MKPSRRDLSLLLPALTAGRAAAQAKGLPSQMFRYEDLKVKTNGENRSRDYFNGDTHTGFHIDMHETSLAPGKAPHPPHHHVHEEVLMLREGTLEVTIAGKTSILTPGSVAYVASNEEHGWKNAGDGRATYFVMAVGR